MSQSPHSFLSHATLLQQSNDFLEHLPQATFVAIDEEMTGIHLPGKARPRRDETPAQHYRAQKGAPERYSLLQLGICLFTQDNAFGCWKVRRYNFYSFPDRSSSREVVLSPDAASFLSQHNMCFDRWIKQGLPYPTLDDTEALLNTFATKQMRAISRSSPHKSPRRSTRPQAVLSRPQDKVFVAECLALVTDWQATPRNNDDELGDLLLDDSPSLLLPECNAFLRRVLFERIGQDYPDLMLESARPLHPNCIRVWAPATGSDSKARRDKLIRHEHWSNLLVETIGLTRIVAALIFACRGWTMDRRTVLFAASGEEIDWERSSLAPLAKAATRQLPVVVHYGFMDLCFLLTHFVRPVLPPTLPDCKSLIQEYFPIVYDTKVMVDECCGKYSDVNSSLGMLFTHLTTQETDLLSHVVDVDTTAATSEQKHEAAYDAYMTGCAFLGLCDEIQLAAGLPRLFPFHDGLRVLYPVQAETSVDILRYMFARNQLFQSSVYTLDLESGDRMKRGKFLESSFRLSGLDGKCSMRVFMEQVQKAVDSRGVHLDFSRIEDGTFLVTVNSSGKLRRGSVADVMATVRQEGLKLEKGLRSVFQPLQIQRMDDYLTELEAEKEGPASSWFSRFLLSLFGFQPWLTPMLLDRKCSIRNDLVVDQSIVEEWKKEPIT
jgi:hypothetical protein